MAKYPGGVTVSGYVAPSDTADIYATHKAQFGYGGYRSATDITARDAITNLRREEGMVVYVISEKKEYRLVGGILNTNWVEIVGGTGTGGTGPSLPQNYLIFNDIQEREDYTLNSADAAVGQLCYVIGEDKEYRLKGGTTNANWALVDNSAAGTGGTGCCNYVPLATIDDVHQYPAADRKEGMVFYVINEDKEYRLKGGKDNIHLTEVIGGDITTTTNNTFINTFGCLNTSSIQQAILEGMKDSVLKDEAVYTDPTTNKPVPSDKDTNSFTFTINKTDFWINDWVYFIGTTNIDKTKTNEVFIEITHRGSTDLINVNNFLNGTTTSTDIEIFGNQTRWYGYFRKPTTGRVDIRAYEVQDGNNAFNINKTIYLFSPNFGIIDGVNVKPADIIFDGLNFFDKSYHFKVLQNTSLVVSLAKVQVTNRGIDLSNYINITKTTKSIVSDSDFIIDKDIFKNDLTDGTYALLVNGMDAGVNIPTYFYGPFTFKKYG